jgi:serine/threonine protein kinase
VEASRHVLRRNPSIPDRLPGAADLPSYDAEELGDLQASVPMPERESHRPGGDRESTEQLRPPAETPETRTRAARKPLERTQPISIASFSRPRRRPARHEPSPPLHVGAPAAPDPAPCRHRQPAPGDVFCERYLVVDKVDHYGMGLVYKARDRQRERAGAPMPLVALKFARQGAGTARETSRLLRQEFLKLAQLNHPNVVKVYDLASDGDLEFIVMEWLSGETLATLLARSTARRLALDKAVDIVRNTARGLAHAHDLGIVHGDVKPSNIFLTNSRAVKLLDFGSSGTTTSDGEGADGERNWATRAYASPQVLTGDAPQPHDDVFALGVTAWCLLSGDRPFGERDALAARAQGLEPAPLPPDAHEHWPAVRHALKFDASDRPRHARRFLREFDTPGEEAAGRPQPHGSPTVAYGAVVATLLASVVWFSVQGVDGPPSETRAALDNAEAALDAGRLVEPEGDSALSWYSAVLEADPANPLAREGLEDLAELHIARAREQLAAGDPVAARADLDIARRVSPDHFGIALVEELIARQGRELLLRARDAATTDVARAESLLAEATRLLPADAPEIARVRDELGRQKTRDRITGLLQDIDGRIIAERLTVPRGDSAVDLLRQAQELAPDNREVTLAADRILTALLFQAMFAISNGELDDAANYLATAKGMGRQHIALARTEYELAKARRAALSAP